MVVGELARRLRAVGFDLAADRLDEVLALAAETREPRIDPLAAPGPLHPPAEERLQGDRQVGGLVAPIFEEGAAAAAIGQRIEVGGIVEAKAGEARQGMGPRHHVDGIDLDDAELFRHALQVTPLGRRRAAALAMAGKVEALGGDGDAAGLAKRKAVGTAGHGALGRLARGISRTPPESCQHFFPARKAPVPLVRQRRAAAMPE